MGSAAAAADVVVVVVAVVDDVAVVSVDELNYKANIYVTSHRVSLPQFELHYHILKAMLRG